MRCDGLAQADGSRSPTGRCLSAVKAAPTRRAAETPRPTLSPAAPSESSPVSSGPMIWPTANATVSVAMAGVQWCGGNERRVTEVTEVTTAKKEPPKKIADASAIGTERDMSGKIAPRATAARTTATLLAPRR